MATATSVLETVRELGAQRERILKDLSALSETDCRYRGQWGGVERNVNFLLRTFSLHELDHIQHLHKLLAARGRGLSEAQILLSKAQALRGELVALLLGLSEEEFDATGPGPDDWSVRQLVEHLRHVDAMYADNITKAVEQGRAATA
jgi:hypothetical protein